MSDHYHYEYAPDRHDHRGQYADDRHDHGLDYAERHHRHYDDESAVRGLREDLGRAEARIGDLEDETGQLRRQLDAVIAQVRILDRLRPTCALCHDATADRQTVRGPACTDCAGDPPDDGPDPDHPEAWAFAEAQEDQAGEPEHGPSAMRRFMREHPLSPDGYVQRSAGCAETSDGMHCGHWYDGGRCCACGLYGPQDEPEEEPPVEGYDPGPGIDDEGGMSEYRYLLPEDYERGQS